MNDSLTGLSPATRRMYEADFADFRAWCAAHAVGEFDVLAARHIFAYLVDVRRRGRSPATIRRRMTALRRIADSVWPDTLWPEFAHAEHRLLDAHPAQASVLVVSDDPIIRSGLRAVLTESGAVCWADSTAHLEVSTATSWDYILVWMNSPRGVDLFGAVSGIKKLGTPITTRVPIVAVHAGQVNRVLQLRLAEAGARYAVPHLWLSKNLLALADLLSAAEVPLKFHLETPLALRQSMNLRLNGDLEILLDAACKFPKEVWTGQLPQSHLPISRAEIARLRRIALEHGGIPSPEFSKYANSLKRPPETPEWPRVREIIQLAFGLSE